MLYLQKLTMGLTGNTQIIDCLKAEALWWGGNIFIGFVLFHLMKLIPLYPPLKINDKK